MTEPLLLIRRARRVRVSSLAGAIFIAAAVFSSLAARAQEPSGQNQAKDASLDAEARALFEAGQLAYQKGRFENALEYFSRAHELSQRPQLLYNIGSAADRLRKDEQALDAFRRYLEALPEAPNRGEVQSRIEVLEKTRARPTDPSPEGAVPVEEEAQPEPEGAEPEPSGEEAEPALEPVEPVVVPDAESTEPDADSAGGPGALAWIVAGTGVALGGAGAVLLVVGQGQISNVEEAERGSRWEDYESDADSGPTLATTGVVLIGVGAAALATGVVWLAVGGGGQSERDASVAITPSGLLARGRF